MRIVFSIYKECNNDGDTELVFEKIIETDLPIEDIKPLYNTTDGYSSYLFAGRTISFWEIVVYQNQEQQIIEYINKIPHGKGLIYSKKEPCKIMIDHYFAEEKAENSVPDLNRCYYYSISEFERGASGLTGIVTAIYNNPILSGIISSLIATAIIAIASKIKRLFKKRGKDIPAKKTEKIYLNIRKLKKNITKMASIDPKDYQITELKRKRNGDSLVRIKTIEKKEYEIVSSPAGKIISLVLSAGGAEDQR